VPSLSYKGWGEVREHGRIANTPAALKVLATQLVPRIGGPRHIASAGERFGEARRLRFGVTRGPFLEGTSSYRARTAVLLRGRTLPLWHPATAEHSRALIRRRCSIASCSRQSERARKGHRMKMP
jgi:hypothetical protein